jgi:hypothetical protein
MIGTGTDQVGNKVHSISLSAAIMIGSKMNYVMLY